MLGDATKHYYKRIQYKPISLVIPCYAGYFFIFSCFILSVLYLRLSIEDFGQVEHQFAQKIGVESRFNNKKGKSIPEATSLIMVVSFSNLDVDRFL